MTFWRLQLDKEGLDVKTQILFTGQKVFKWLPSLPCPALTPGRGNLSTQGAPSGSEKAKNTGEGWETIKMGCVSLIVLSIKVLVVRPQQDFQPGPITRHWRADGTSISSCGGLLKWLTSGYHLKYNIINAWVQLFPSLALEPVYFRKSTEFFQGSEWLVTGFNWSRSTHCWSLHFPPSSNWYRWLFIYLKLSYLLYYYCLTVSAGFYCFYIFEAFIF